MSNISAYCDTHDPALLGLDGPGVWDGERAFAHLLATHGVKTRRTAERRVRELGILPPMLTAGALRDEHDRLPNQVVLDWTLARARAKRTLTLFAQLGQLGKGAACLHAHDARGTRYWVPLPVRSPDTDGLLAALQTLRTHVGKDVLLLPHGALVGCLRDAPVLAGIALAPTVFLPVLAMPMHQRSRLPGAAHLKRLEAESIEILREAVAEGRHPTMLYAIGKESSVMVHLARKAFFPAPPPFPLLHIDTRWQFQEMYAFRDRMAEESGMQMLVHVNPDAVARDLNPFEHGAVLHTELTQTQGLKQALAAHGFDLVLSGGRRDEDSARARESVFALRSGQRDIDHQHQRPELWNLYNPRRAPGERMCVFPLSNWTELDIWHYIGQEAIPVVPLYFASLRPVVAREGRLLVVDDSRFRLLPGERILERSVRFWSLGCYPLTGAVVSQARTVPEVIAELMAARHSEAQWRAIDGQTNASMAHPTQEGYF